MHTILQNRNKFNRICVFFKARLRTAGGNGVMATVIGGRKCIAELAKKCAAAASLGDPRLRGKLDNVRCTTIIIVLSAILTSHVVFGQQSQPERQVGVSPSSEFRGEPLPDSPGGESTRMEVYRRTIGQLYHDLDLHDRLDQSIFRYAMVGYYKLRKEYLLAKDNLLTIIDYTRPSTEPRLYVIDLKTAKLLFHTLVAHGRNTGENFAEHFSNQPRSHKTSLGFYVTGKSYDGENGYSLKLKGMEASLNDNAEKRSIVIHGAWYVSRAFADKCGRLGRSWGCPALPLKVTKEVIDTIKEGSCLFIYFDDPDYLSASEYLK
jgi:hypothetical protein